MQFATVISLVLLASFASADVSHLTDAYLPPLHSSAGGFGTDIGGKYASSVGGHQSIAVAPAHGHHSYHASGPATHSYRISHPAPVFANSYANQNAHDLTGHDSSSSYSADRNTHLLTGHGSSLSYSTDPNAHVVTGHGSSSTYSAPSNTYLPPVHSVHRFANPAISSYSSASSAHHGSYSAPSAYSTGFDHGSTGIDTKYAANGGYIY